MKNNHILVSVLIIAVAGAVLYFLMHRHVEAPTLDSSSIGANNQLGINNGGQNPTYLFACGDGKTISATFHIPEDADVDLTLSDGRTMRLPHALSADGARYANADESFVFWNKGNTAFIQEKGVTTYDSCVIQDASAPNTFQ